MIKYLKIVMDQTDRFPTPLAQIMSMARIMSTTGHHNLFWDCFSLSDYFHIELPPPPQRELVRKCSVVACVIGWGGGPRGRTVGDKR
jgi:hypothetical protein